MSFDANAHRASSLRRAGKRPRPAGCAARSCCASSARPCRTGCSTRSHPQPGQRVLELAAGLGETGMLAAELVAPIGGVIISDQAEAMLEGARARAAELGLANVEFQVLERRMDRPAAGERRRRAVPLGLHADGRPRRRAARDPARAAPGGRLALAVWDARRAQPVGAAARAGADRARARRRRRDAGERPGPFALGDPGRVPSAARAGRLRRDRASRRSSSRAATPSFEELLGDHARPLAQLPRRRASRPEAEIARDPGLAGAALRAVHRRRRRAGDPGAHARRLRERLSRARPRPAIGLSVAVWIACAPMIYDDDADLTLLDGKTVAIIGYGSQGHAHALNLKDSGVNVVVGLREDSSSVAEAREQGLEVLPVVEAASRGDLVMILAARRAPPRGLGGRRSATASPRATCCCSATASRSTTARSTPPPGRRRRDGRAEGPRPPRAPPVHRRQRRPGPDRRRAGRHRQRARARAGLRQGHRLHARRRDRDDASRTRPRPTCSASRPSSAAAPPSWSRRASRRSSRRAMTRRWPTSSACTSSS